MSGKETEGVREGRQKEGERGVGRVLWTLATILRGTHDQVTTVTLDPNKKQSNSLQLVYYHANHLGSKPNIASA